MLNVNPQTAWIQSCIGAGSVRTEGGELDLIEAAGRLRRVDPARVPGERRQIFPLRCSARGRPEDLVDTHAASPLATHECVGLDAHAKVRRDTPTRASLEFAREQEDHPCRESAVLDGAITSPGEHVAARTSRRSLADDPCDDRAARPSVAVLVRVGSTLVSPQPSRRGEERSEEDRTLHDDCSQQQRAAVVNCQSIGSSQPCGRATPSFSRS